MKYGLAPAKAVLRSFFKKIKLVLFFAFLVLCIPSQAKHNKAKVYDCFCFCNEFELLTIRLEELWDKVDYFVLVESIETQKGNPKPLYFRENKQRFAKYLSKIVPIAIVEHHPEFSFWERENYQRNGISRGLKGCQPQDMIIISDLDEIPRSSLLPGIINQLQHNPLSPDNARSLHQTIYYYQLNRQTPTGECWGGGHWIGTVVTTYKNLQSATPQYFRDNRGKFPIINNAGWHFTWTGGKEKVRLKAISTVEGGADNPNQITDEEIEKRIRLHPVVPIDDSFPRYVVENQEYFKSIGFIAPPRYVVDNQEYFKSRGFIAP